MPPETEWFHLPLDFWIQVTLLHSLDLSPNALVFQFKVLYTCNIQAFPSLPAWDMTLNASKSYQCWVERKAESLDSHQHSPSPAKMYPQMMEKSHVQPLATHSIRHLWSREGQIALGKSPNSCAILHFPHCKCLLQNKTLFQPA